MKIFIIITILVFSAVFFYLLNKDLKEFNKYRYKKKTLRICSTLEYQDYLKIYKPSYRFNTYILSLSAIIIIILLIIYTLI